MRYTNAAQLPKSLVWAITNSHYELEPGAISVTRLIDSPRIRVLEEEHSDELEQDVSDSVYAMLGSAVHQLLAFYPNGIPEKRYCAELGGQKICGTPDLIEDGVLYDYKVPSTWINSLGMRDEWENQLNVYRWLLRENGIVVNSLKLVAIFRDWSKSQLLNPREGYPAYPSQVYDVRMWTLRDTEAYILDRITMHQRAQEQLTYCTPQERWQRDGVWAVYYNGKARAERLLPGEIEARDWIVEAGGPIDAPIVDVPNKRGYSIVKRLNEWRRCKLYCPVAEFCAQWKEFNDSSTGAISNSSSETGY